MPIVTDTADSADLKMADFIVADPFRERDITQYMAEIKA